VYVMGGDAWAGWVESKDNCVVANCHVIHYALHKPTLTDCATHSLTHNNFHFTEGLNSYTRPSPSEASR